jgi:hypothetical protein
MTEKQPAERRMESRCSASTGPRRGPLAAAFLAKPKGARSLVKPVIWGMSAERGYPMHARVAYFRLKSGSFEQVVRAVEAPGGLLGIFREQAGFRSYELIETGSGLVSVSHWDSSKQADAASSVAAAWAADHIDNLVTLQQSDTGEVVLSSLAPAAAH